MKMWKFMNKNYIKLGLKYKDLNHSDNIITCICKLKFYHNFLFNFMFYL